MPFTFILEDPSGNSFIQNPSAPTADQYCKKTQWIRSVDDYTAMGYPVDQATLNAENDKLRLADQSSKLNGFQMDTKNMKRQTKDEQEALLSKASTYAQKFDGKTVTDAGFVDFS